MPERAAMSAIPRIVPHGKHRNQWVSANVRSRTMWPEAILVVSAESPNNHPARALFPRAPAQRRTKQ